VADANTPNEGPLAGLTIIEIATFVAGPSAGLTLAQLGARVVRIDPLGGAADIRRWPVAENGQSLYWSALNRGKRSVMIDLRSHEGQDLVQRMICAPGPERGLLIDNQPRAEWLSWQQLSSRRADVIHVHIEGHDDGRPAVDYTVNAEVGIPLLTGPEETDLPINQAVPAWDLLCGMSSATAILAALRQRDKTGLGARVDIALANVAQAAIANLGWYSEAMAGVNRPRTANSIYGSYGEAFRTRDGRFVMVVALTAAQWRALVLATGSTDAIQVLENRHNVRFTTDEAARFRFRRELADIFGPWFAHRDSHEVTTELSQRVLRGDYRTLREAADRLDGPLAAFHQPGIGTVITADSPFRSQHMATSNAPASALGEDTIVTIKDLAQVTDQELSFLIRSGVVMQAQRATER
jgi:2-methylfumaryl-CoA isomerase